jgi:hypothetical protein
MSARATPSKPWIWAKAQSLTMQPKDRRFQHDLAFSSDVDWNDPVSILLS